MHAAIDELLKLRDEVPADGAVAAHVRGCAQCGGELERLRGLTAELRALPDRWTPPRRWEAIAGSLTGSAGLAASQEARRPGWRWPLAAAAAVAGAIAVLAWQGEGSDQPDPLQAPVISRSDDVHQPRHALAAHSLALEQVLAALPEEPRLVRAETALTLAELQDRIRWVDDRLEFGLAFGEETGFTPQQAELLWRERVDLLNSLVAVRYAQARAPF